MKCYCREKSYSLRLGDESLPDPIWCTRCNGSIDIDDIQLTENLKREILEWSENFNKLLRNEINPENILEFLQQHNRNKMQLKKMIRQELGREYIVS